MGYSKQTEGEQTMKEISDKYLEAVLEEYMFYQKENPDFEPDE